MSSQIDDRPGEAAPPAPRRFPWHLAIPCLLIALYAAPLVPLGMPSSFDSLDESYEPLKTLKFVHSRGQAYHKWGPMPQFLYAPLYAPPLLYWVSTGGLSRPGEDYPYGFARPHEQMGLLIVLARLAGLGVGLAGTVALGRGLLRLAGSRWAVGLALTFCVATSPEVVFKFVATKPDGLMLAFLAAAMGAYATIVADGLTRGRGVALSLLAVASISCKELTAPAFVLPYLGIAAAGLARSRDDPAARRRFLADYAVAIAAGLAAYAVVNVAYAPTTWAMRMDEWLLGPGKDPAVWAPPGYTRAQYLGDVVGGLLQNFDAGGLAVLALAAVVPTRRWLLGWLPTIGFVAIVVLTAGYMPPYFLGPANLTAALPVAAALAALGRARLPRPARLAGAAALGAALAFNLWGGNYAWARAVVDVPAVLEAYCRASIDRRERLHTGNLYVRQPGSDRLSYLGFRLDDRPLGEFMGRPADMPDVFALGRLQLKWLAEMPERSARNEMLKASGHSYDRFAGVESLGYREAEVVRPALPPPLLARAFPWYAPGPRSELVIYRRDAAGTPAPPPAR